jgi:hypothetical protein
MLRSAQRAFMLLAESYKKKLTIENQNSIIIVFVPALSANGPSLGQSVLTIKSQFLRVPDAKPNIILILLIQGLLGLPVGPKQNYHYFELARHG